ncbi:Uncharacterised protein [Mycobacteroides abscessus subsp. massiliense]|nr:Uncharacterised protein [Mycobacteroides abscessus subsp. massiliense]
MQGAARPEAVRQQRHGARLEQPPLVVAGLGPGVREEHPRRGQRSRRQQVLQHVQGVAADQPDVLDALTIDRREQLRQALAVYLHRKHIELWFF